MSSEDFFEETREQSQVKARIVSDYFARWARIMTSIAKKRGGKIVYMDLYAGQGCYDDGTKSTPILVLENALQHPDLCNMLVSIFNDRKPKNVACLDSAIKAIPGIDTLKHAPVVGVSEVNEQFTSTFRTMHLAPTFLFLDPCGYKGLSVDLVNSVVKDWGCEAVFFFNYNRINPGLANSTVESHINAIFGKTRADALRKRIKGMKPAPRERAILAELVSTLQEKHGKYVLPFRFMSEDGNRTSHYLVFVSKDFLGYDLMKDVMARESSSSCQGIPSFEYDPKHDDDQFIMELFRPLDDLAEDLLKCFAGRQLTMRQVYEEHTVGTPYISRNYKDVLRTLEAARRITADPPASKRRPRNGEPTFGDGVVVTFPPRTL